MVCGTARLSAAAWTGMVCPVRHAGLSAVGVPWWYHYEANAPEVFDKAGMIAGASGFLGCASAIAGSLWRARQSRHVTTYGSARWATNGEIDRAGLLSASSVFLGRKRWRYLRHDGPEHVMAFAPTRSGMRPHIRRG